MRSGKRSGRWFVAFLVIASLPFRWCEGQLSQSTPVFRRGDSVLVSTWNAGDVWIRRHTLFDIAPSEAELIVERVVSVLGVTPNFELNPMPGSKDMAAAIRGGLRLINYDPVYIERFADPPEHWGATGAFAHEIGHHVLGHTVEGGVQDRRAMEMEADRFAGGVLQKLHATLEQASLYIAVAASDTATREYPAKVFRLQELAEGYRRSARGEPIFIPRRPVTNVILASGSPPPADTGPQVSVVRMQIAALRNHDTSTVRRLFVPGAGISTSIIFDAHGDKSRNTFQESLWDLLREAGDVTMPFDERTLKLISDPSGPSPRVRHLYAFSTAGHIHHCGTEEYTFALVGSSWLISRVVDHQFAPELCPPETR